MNKVRRIITTAIIVLPLLIYYEILFLGIGLVVLIELILLSLAVLVVAAQNKILSFKNVKEHVILITWLIIITLIMMLFAPYSNISYENRNSFIFLIILSIVLFLGLSGVFDFEYGIRVYRFTAIGVSVFLVIQILLFYIMNIPISGKLPFLQLNDIYCRAFEYLSTRAIHSGGYVRFSSVFSEPAHYVQYTLPFLCMKLFGYKNMIAKNNVYAIILTMVIMLSASGLGIVMCGVIWGAHFLSKGKKNIIKRVMKIMLGLIIIIAAYNILMNFTFFSRTVARLFVSTEDVSSKADYRIYRGFEFYMKIPIIHQLLGVGFRNTTISSQFYGIILKFDSPGVNYEYMNAVARILVYSGIIGFILYGIMMKILFRKSDTCGKVLVVTFFLVCVSSSVFMSATWQLYMLLIFAGLQSEGLSESLKISHLQRR